MSRRATRWTPEQQKALKQLKEEQMNRNQVDWLKISDQLNSRFPNSFRNPKRCRDKYVNFIKVIDKGQICQLWSTQQLGQLETLYIEHGPCWNYFTTLLPNKSENCIKNKFNVCLRRVAKILNVLEGTIFKQWKRSICYQMLLAMVDFVNQIKKIIANLDLTVNKQSLLFQFRSKIISICFRNQQTYQEEELINLIKLIKSLNSKIRCYGVFKVKNRRRYKFTEKGLESVYQFDKVINEPYFKMEEKTNLVDKQSQKQVLSFEIDQSLMCQSLSLPIQTNFFHVEEQQKVNCCQQFIEVEDIGGNYHYNQKSSHPLEREQLFQN